MFVSRKLQRKPRTKLAVSPTNTQTDAADTGPVSLRPPHVSFDQEAAAPEFQIDRTKQRSHATQIVADAGGDRGAYTAAALESLRSQQKQRPASVPKTTSAKETCYMPIQADIDMARLSREARRNALNNADSFIPLSQDLAVGTGESRLVTEEQDETQEAYDDYSSGSKLLFGPQAISHAKQLFREEMHQAISHGQDQDVQMMDWQTEKIMQATGMAYLEDIAGATVPVIERETLPIPNETNLVEFDEAFSNLTAYVNEMDAGYQQGVVQVEQSKAEIAASTTAINRMETELSILAEKHDFFQALDLYISDLQSFLEAKTSTIVELQESILQIAQNILSEKVSLRWNVLDDSCREFSGAAPLMVIDKSRNMDLPSIADLIAQKDSVFNDASNDFKSILTVKNRLELWKLNFSKEYAQCYGDASLQGAFDFFVRYQLLDWNPFVVNTFNAGRNSF